MICPWPQVLELARNFWTIHLNLFLSQKKLMAEGAGDMMYGRQL